MELYMFNRTRQLIFNIYFANTADNKVSSFFSVLGWTVHLYLLSLMKISFSLHVSKTIKAHCKQQGFYINSLSTDNEINRAFSPP